MMDHKPFTHRRRSIRLRGYDYAQAGAYFITICRQNRECVLGEISNGQMYLYEFGEIVLHGWDALPKYYPGVELDEFMVMPNHIHGILVITAGHAPSRLENTGDAPIEKRTLGQLIGYFKFNVSKEINQRQGTAYAKVFQRGYYEHIIRNEREWNSIAQYIRNNPAQWSDDLDNPADRVTPPPTRTRLDYWRSAGLL